MGVRLILSLAMLACAGCGRSTVSPSDEWWATCLELELAASSGRLCSDGCTATWEAADDRCAAELRATDEHSEAAAARACMAGCELTASCTSDRFGESSTVDCECSIACLSARSPEYQRLATRSSACWYDENVRAACF